VTLVVCECGRHGDYIYPGVNCVCGRVVKAAHVPVSEQRWWDKGAQRRHLEQLRCAKMPAGDDDEGGGEHARR